MARKDFGKLIESEESLLRYLMRRRFPRERVICPSCGSNQVYRLANARFRCAPHKYTFGLLTGTWLGEAKIGATKLARLVRAYADGRTVAQAARGSGVSHATARRVYAAVWEAVHAHQRALPPEIKCGNAEEKKLDPTLGR